MRKKVLLVDDDLDLQDIIKGALELEGYEVLVASNGKEALNMLKEQKDNVEIGCIILDLMMPVMDGTEMLDLLRKDPKWSNIPVIISTAKGTVDKSDVEKSQAVIKKPMKIETLYDVIEKYSKPTH
mgnify:CR=1 FL=1